MKKHFLLLTLFFVLLSPKIFSQTVYINQTGDTYHTKACAIYTPKCEAVPLWKARDVLGRKPCKKCNPPTKDTKAVPKKKSGKKKAPVKKTAGTAAPAKK